MDDTNMQIEKKKGKNAVAKFLGNLGFELEVVDDVGIGFEKKHCRCWTSQIDGKDGDDDLVELNENVKWKGSEKWVLVWQWENWVQKKELRWRC